MSVPSVRTSERSTFKRCQQRWWWSYVDGLKPIHSKSPLWFGTGIHLALAEWYLPGSARGPLPADTWREYARDQDRYVPLKLNDDELIYSDAVDLGVAMMENYIREFGKDEEWEVLVTEQAFKYLVRDRATRRLIARYLGTFDGAYRNRRTGEVWLMEHKTAAQIVLTHLALDDQAGSYLMVVEAVLRKAGLIGPEEEVVGVMYNYLRKSKGDNRDADEDGYRRNKPTKKHYIEELGDAVKPNMKLAEMAEIAQSMNVRVVGDISKDQGSPLFVRHPVYRSRGDKESMHQRIIAEVGQMEFVRKTELPTKTPTRDCNWDCDFFRMCQLHESKDDWEVYRDNMYNKTDPYADHRKSA